MSYNNITSTDSSAPIDPVTSRRRIVELDVLRGFALCGIILVNMAPVTHFGWEVGLGPAQLSNASGWLQLLVQQRFFPIFSLLFGISFALLLRSSTGQVAHPSVLLLRRVLFLGVLGALHQFAQPGEALLPYAIVALVVLLPASWLPRWVTAVGAVVLILASLIAAGGGITLIPGMFLVGSALVRYGVVDKIGNSMRTPIVLLILFAAVSIPTLIWQLHDLENSGFNMSSGVAGLAMAGMYVTGMLVLLGTPLRHVLIGAFANLGRMALTNYVTATLLLLAVGTLLDFPASTSWTTALLCCFAILVVQWAGSWVWLRYFRQGPLEWLWRMVTRWRVTPLRR
ncbi:DUF418 domain-containing protein [Agreia sp.]|uniref:DUF418 domain-containing protein n=1 Tax=Agreia sp. TaxID=1872416 RepID=UPI0035BC0E92